MTGNTGSRLYLARFTNHESVDGSVWMDFLAQETPSVILIVDDNAYNLEVLSRRLERRGFETICVDSGAAALAAVENRPVDLVLLDIMMPGMTGMEVLAEIRKTFSKPALPVIMVTSRGDSEDVVEALSRGANDYVMKPIDFPVALARIQTQLSQKLEFSKISRPRLSYSVEAGEKFGNYLIKEKVGQGGMGAVFKVYDANLDRLVALKVVLPGHELTPSQIERFAREAKAIAKIRHPNIVNVYEVGREPCNYFTMDFIEGKNLSQLIKEETLSAEVTVRICLRIASALHHAHSKGIIHRDLKPSNIMVDRNYEPHLMDFGLAKLECEEEQITRTGDMLGTPEYMAPEQIDPSVGPIDNRSDIYALGVILYEMLTGLTPFNGTPVRVLWQKLNREPMPPSAVNPRVTPDLERFCLKAMARLPEDRFFNAGEMVEALEINVVRGHPFEQN